MLSVIFSHSLPYFLSRVCVCVFPPLELDLIRLATELLESTNPLPLIPTPCTSRVTDPLRLHSAFFVAGDLNPDPHASALSTSQMESSPQPPKCITFMNISPFQKCWNDTHLT